MEEWKEYKIGDVCSIRRGASPRPIQDYLSKKGMPWVKIADATATSSMYLDKTKEYIIEKGIKKSVIVLPGTLIVSNSATPGLPKIIRIKACVHDGWLIIDNYKDVIRDFLYYQFINIRRNLSNQANGSVFMNLKTDIVKEFSIKVPSLVKQKIIVAILKSLDDKIEVNRRINENLEQQAQALFKSWFVDFEPFRDGEFVESELGMIPKGWRVGSYDEIISSTISGDWGKEKESGNYTHKVACIRGCDFQDIKNGLRGKTPERYIIEKNYQNKHFCDKDILVEISGGTATVSTGRVCPVSQKLIDSYDGDIICTNFCRLVRPINGYSAFLYYSWLYKYNNKVMFAYENGTSGIKNFRIKDFTSLEPIIIPPLEVSGDFQNLIDTTIMQMQAMGIESRRLAELRDTLLPRLMSGELDVNNVAL